MKPDVQAAIKHLTLLRERLTPAGMAYWTAPNVLLTLAGARSFCDGIFWTDNAVLANAWDEQIAAGLDVLSPVTHIYMRHEVVQEDDDSRYASYELVLREPLRRTLQTSELVAADAIDAVVASDDDTTLRTRLLAALAANPHLQEFDDTDHEHIAFGLLAGYPEAAILGAVRHWRREAERERYDPFAPRLIDADIRGADYYACPQPVYQYPRELIDHPAIVAHETAWSGALREYYASDFHASLEADESYVGKLAELGLDF